MGKKARSPATPTGSYMRDGPFAPGSPEEPFGATNSVVNTNPQHAPSRESAELNGGLVILNCWSSRDVPYVADCLNALAGRNPEALKALEEGIEHACNFLNHPGSDIRLARERLHVLDRLLAAFRAGGGD